MPRMDVSQIDEASDYSPIPEGQYACECDEVNEKETRNGDEMWSIKWTVISGEYEGKSFFDNLVFTEAALPRVKMVAKRVAQLDVDSGPIDFMPEHLLGKRAMIEVEINEYTDDNGKLKRNNKPTFAGYDVYQEIAPGDHVPVQEDTRVLGAKPGNASGGKKKEVPF